MKTWRPDTHPDLLFWFASDVAEVPGVPDSCLRVDGPSEGESTIDPGECERLRAAVLAENQAKNRAEAAAAEADASPAD